MTPSASPENAWRMHGGCMEDALRMHGGCMEDE